MALEALWNAMKETPLSEAIRTAPFAFAGVEIVHVIALSIVFGSIVLVDLRLVGLASANVRVSAISKDLLHYTWGAWGVCLISGFILFMARPDDYLINAPFIAKMGVMALAGANMLYFHFAVYRTVGQWDLGPPPSAAKLSGALSLCFWLFIVAMGRQIGYAIGIH